MIIFNCKNEIQFGQNGYYAWETRIILTTPKLTKQMNNIPRLSITKKTFKLKNMYVWNTNFQFLFFYSNLISRLKFLKYSNFSAICSNLISSISKQSQHLHATEQFYFIVHCLWQDISWSFMTRNLLKVTYVQDLYCFIQGCYLPKIYRTSLHLIHFKVYDTSCI